MTRKLNESIESFSNPNTIGLVSSNERINLLKQYSLTVWLTGLSASGKSTLAYALERALIDTGKTCFVLDGDHVRHGLSRNLGFSLEDRYENIRRIAEVAKLMNEAGLIVIVACISPIMADRSMAKQIIGPEKFREVYVMAPLITCESRDPKGHYSKARSGELENFTGISAIYEPPISPHLTLDTLNVPIQENLKELLLLFN